MILKCQCLAIVETCLNHQFSSPMFPPFSTLPVFNQATCNLVLPAENMVDLPHRRSNNPRVLPGSVHYQLPAPANTSCTMRCSNTQSPDVGPTQRCTKMYKFSLFTQKKKKIYIYILNFTIIMTTFPLCFFFSLFLGVLLFFKKKKKNIYIYISNVQLIITTVPLRFLLSLFWGVLLLFQKPSPVGVSQFFFRATTTATTTATSRPCCRAIDLPGDQS